MEAMDVSFSFCVLVDENGLFASDTNWIAILATVRPLK